MFRGIVMGNGIVRYGVMWYEDRGRLRGGLLCVMLVLGRGMRRYGVSGIGMKWRVVCV